MKKHTSPTSSDDTKSTSFIGVFLNEKVTELDFVYRGTSSIPETKFSEGFVARGSNLNLSNHIYNWPSNSAYVSSSLSKDAAAGFAVDKLKVGFVYEINPPSQGINVENHLYDDFLEGRVKKNHMEAFLSEHEVSIPHQIEPSDIKGAWKVETFTDVSGTEGYTIKSEFIANPNYQPNTAVRLAQGARALGHAVTAIGAGLDGYNLIQSYQGSQNSGNYQGFFKEGARIIASWTAAATMGTAPAMACGIIGAGLGPAGSLAGSVICGAVGSVIGYTGASHMINKALKNDGAFDPTKFKYKDENTRVEAKWLDASQKMNAIISGPANTGQPDIQIIKENTEFLQTMGFVNGANQLKLIDLSNETHHKLNAVLHEVKASQREIKAIYQENKKAQDTKDQEAKSYEEAINSYRGMDACFNVIGKLGTVTGNDTIEKIGAVGAAGVSIAANAAMLTGAIPGIAFTGWGLMIPYAGIALAGLAIITTLFSKKHKQDDSMMKALQALSDQIEAFRKEVEKHFEHLNNKMDAYHQDIVDKLTVLSNLLKTALNDGFDEINFKLDTIQEDLNRLGELLVKGLGAEYLKDFVIAISAIDQLTNDKEKREGKIKDNLMTLTTWLTDVTMIKNTNGLWALPGKLTEDNVFSTQHLRSHDQLLGDELSHRLGYVAQLLCKMPGINFESIQLAELPNIALFKQGVNAYAQGRLHLGSSVARNMDRNNVSISKIKRTADNALMFMEKMNVQDTLILTTLMKHYERNYIQYVTDLNHSVSARLKSGAVPGFEFPIQDKVSDQIPWPVEITSPGNPSLPFEYVLSAIQKSPDPKIQRLIHKALSLGIGAVKANYSPINYPATRETQFFEDRKANHIINNRGARYQVEVYYELNGLKQQLFTTNGLSGRVMHQSGTLRLHGWRHNEIGAENQNKVNTQNNEPLAAFFSRLWPSTTLEIPADHSANEITDGLKEAIIHEITEKCVVNVPIATAKQRIESRHFLISETLKHQEELDNLTSNMSYIKSLLKRLAKLMGRSEQLDFNKLWSGEQFNDASYCATHYKLSSRIHNMTRAIEQSSDRSRSSQPIVQNLRYCQQLLEAIIQHETLTAHQNLAEIAEELEVDAAIVIDSKRIICDFEKGTKLGVGSFGQVYKGIDAITRTNVAIKVFFTGASLQKDARGELDVTARLSQESAPSPHLVQIMGVTRLADHRMALVMEYVDNSTLWDHLHEKPVKLSWENAMSVSGQIIEGITYLHERGITHGDLKSANILLTSDFQVKICDYGLAKVACSTRAVGSTRLTSTNTHVGTQAYRAPELFKDKKARPNPQTDMYSLSIVMYEMITRLRPFHDTDGDDQTILPLLLTYMNGLSQDDPFEIPDLEADASDAQKNFRALFLPIFNECRNMNPQARPSAAMLSQRIRLN